MAGIALRRVPDVVSELEAANRISVLHSRHGNRYTLLDWRPLEDYGTNGIKRRTSVSDGGTPVEAA